MGKRKNIIVKNLFGAQNSTVLSKWITVLIRQGQKVVQNRRDDVLDTVKNYTHTHTRLLSNKGKHEPEQNIDRCIVCIFEQHSPLCYYTVLPYYMLLYRLYVYYTSEINPSHRARVCCLTFHLISKYVFKDKKKIIII